MFDCEILDYGKHWDGHTEKDVTRLLSLPKAQLSCEGTTSDTISRQEAIDALDFEIVHMTAYCDGKNEGNPLAQYNKGLEDGKKAIEALPTIQPEPHWIPVSERLPEKNGEYLVTTQWLNGDIDVSLYEYSATYKEWNDGDMCGQKVIAWMPLPTPYTK